MGKKAKIKIPGATFLMLVNGDSTLDFLPGLDMSQYEQSHRPFEVVVTLFWLIKTLIGRTSATIFSSTEETRLETWDCHTTKT